MARQAQVIGIGVDWKVDTDRCDSAAASSEARKAVDGKGGDDGGEGIEGDRAESSSPSRSSASDLSIGASQLTDIITIVICNGQAHCSQ